MITKRLLKVQMALLCGLGAVFLLPKAPKAVSAGIAMTLPDIVGAWIGEDAEVTEREREILAKDTQFARKIYTGPAGDQIFVSIVLSGDDMTNSIHRPERCLPAQGWTIQSSERRTIPLKAGGQFPLTKLRTLRMVERREKSSAPLYDLNYYWFVGSHEMTASHLTRTEIDLRDRILHGYNQRWAYVTVTSLVTEHWKNPQRTEVETSEMIEKFVQELAPALKTPDGKSLF
jgi:EpsI family protein